MVDQKELISLLLNQLSIMKTINFIAILAVIIGPVAAVLITLWHQDRKQKIDTKKRIFLTLMAHRRALPPNPEWANALNLIDVVFGDHPQIVALWHEYYAFLAQIQSWEETTQQREHKYLELLSAMAHSLGYGTLQQTDIDKFYVPRAHGEQSVLTAEIQKELLRVLKDTARFVVDPKPIGKKPLQ
jgi:hypothetical protein